MAQTRYRAQYNNYIDTRKKLNDVTGEKLCISEKDMKKGIRNIEAKLESMCFGFRRWDALFGERQNVKPTSVYEPVIIQRENDSPLTFDFTNDNMGRIVEKILPMLRLPKKSQKKSRKKKKAKRSSCGSSYYQDSIEQENNKQDRRKEAPAGTRKI
jgi:hypothetical protein